MEWLARLFGGPSRRPREILNLAVDLTNLTVCGLGRGANPATVEERLGSSLRPRRKRRGLLSYPELGLQITTDFSHGLSGFTVIANPDPRGGGEFRAFEGLWLPWGSKEPPSEATLIRTLGRPTLRDCQDEEICVEWNRAPALVEADYALDASLLAICVDFGRQSGASVSPRESCG